MRHSQVSQIKSYEGLCEYNGSSLLIIAALLRRAKKAKHYFFKIIIEASKNLPNAKDVLGDKENPES